MSELDAAYREAYGDPDVIVRESYRMRPRAKTRQAVQQAKHRPKPLYFVTADARVLCDCGVYVYTEVRNGNPPALPANCWRCDQPLAALTREDTSPTKGPQ